MSHFDTVVRYLDAMYRFEGYIPCSCVFTSVRRKKAEKYFGIPVRLRLGYSHRQNVPTEAQWENDYAASCVSLKRQYPEMYDRLFLTPSPPADRIRAAKTAACQIIEPAVLLAPTLLKFLANRGFSYPEKLATLDEMVKEAMVRIEPFEHPVLQNRLLVSLRSND